MKDVELRVNGSESNDEQAGCGSNDEQAGCGSNDEQAGCGSQDSLQSTSVQDDPKLIAEGWERRQLADPQRAAEAIELYESLGFEVLAKELEESDFGDACKTCAVAGCHGYVMIYTRKKQ